MEIKVLKREKKIIPLICIQLFVSFNILSQLNGDFRSIQNGNWSNKANWEEYNSGNWIAPSYPPSQLDGQISVRHNIQISADQVMDQVMIDTGASIIIQPGVTVTVTNSVSTIELYVKGKVINSGMLFFSPSSIMLADSGGTYIHNSSVASSAVLDATQLHAQSYWVYRGNGTLAPPVTFSNRHYGHLVFESTAGNWNRTISGSNPASCTSLRIDQGVMLINNYTGLLTIHGNLCLDGTLVNGSGLQKIVLDSNTGQLSGSNLNNFFDTLIVQLTARYSLENTMTTSPSSTFTVLGFLDCKTNNLVGNSNGSTFSLMSDAWLKTSHSEGIIASISGFSANNFSENANYEFSGDADQFVNFYSSSMKNLTVNGSINSMHTLKTSYITISGTLNLIEGLFSIDSNTINLSGTPITGQSQNLLSTTHSSLQFTGIDTGVYIPSSISILKNLYLNKLQNNISQQNDLIIIQTLSLLKGNLVTGAYCVRLEGELNNCIFGGTDSSYIDGCLSLKLPTGDSITCLFPIGKNWFHPLQFRNLTTIANTELKAEVYETIPTGTSDGISLQGVQSNRYYNIKAIGNNGITVVDEISIIPNSVTPALDTNSKIGFSTNNSAYSFHGIGGIINANNITSTLNLSSCQLNDLCSSDGSYISIADAGISEGIFIDTNCISLLRLKLFIQGFYKGNGSMRATIDPSLFPFVCDTVIVELHSPVTPFVVNYLFISTVDTSGNISIELPSQLWQSFYLVVKHRNSLEIWSAIPVQFDSLTVTYDFSDGSNKTFGNNTIEIDAGVYAMISGDFAGYAISNPACQDGLIDSYDFAGMESDLFSFSTGYRTSDLTGDNIIDISDYSLLENNINQGVQVIRP